MHTLPVVVAHQGGWDEILLFVAPVVLAIWVVRRIEKRGRHDSPPADDQTESPDPQPTDAE